MDDEVIYKCPLTGQDCTYHCAWFKDGQCCMASIPDLMEKLDDVITKIDELTQAVEGMV